MNIGVPPTPPPPLCLDFILSQSQSSIISCSKVCEIWFYAIVAQGIDFTSIST